MFELPSRAEKRSSAPNKAMKLLSRDSTGTQSGDILPSSHEPVEVEPKTYFANERTFIQWISASLLLLTVSSIMMGSGSYNGTSSVIAFSSLVLVAYASYVYFRRVKLLRSGEGYGYLDFVGPSILAAGVGVGVFIVFADAVKGSEFVHFPWEGDTYKDEDDRRSLMSALPLPPQMPKLPKMMRPVKNTFELQQVDGKCSRYSIDGINLLEYQPRDIILSAHHKSGECTRQLIVATPQALVSHPLSGEASAYLSEIPDTEIQSMTMVGDRHFALSIGPYKTELIEFDASDAEIVSRFSIQDSTSTTGSMVFVPSSVPEEGKLYIYLDGAMHSYHLHSNDSSSSVSSLSRVGSINMKVLNRGLADSDDPITAMEHFEGLTYVLRERQNTIEAWDFNRAAFVAEMPMPAVPSRNDKWVGMAFQRSRKDEEEEEISFLRKSKVAADTSVYLHMPLDTFPPQLWSFRLEEHEDVKKYGEHNIFSFPECYGAAMN